MKQDSKYSEFVYVFRELKRTLHQAVTKQAEKVGITDIQFYVFYALQGKDELGMSELAEQLRLGNSTLSGIIDRMEKSGFVERRRSEEDRRSISIHLTEQGKVIAEKTKLLHRQVFSKLNTIPEEEWKSLVGKLQLIIKLIESEKEGD